MEETTLFGRLPEGKINVTLNSFSNKKRYIEAIAYFFILLFTYSSLRIFLDYKMFVKEIYGYSVINSVKWGLAVFCCGELITTVILAIPKWRFLGLVQTFILMSVLNIAGFVILQKAPVIPYFFGGIFPKIDFFGHLFINIALLFIALLGLLLSFKIRSEANIVHQMK
jgi:hypothetical protein